MLNNYIDEPSAFTEGDLLDAIGDLVRAGRRIRMVMDDLPPWLPAQTLDLETSPMNLVDLWNILVPVEGFSFVISDEEPITAF